MIFNNSSHAQGRSVSLVRDAEIEALISDYAAPLMKAAGLRKGSVSFYLVNSSAFNAFVSGSGMFVNTGLILQAETPGEVIGVIAHELGHIKGGHQIRLRERLEDAKRLAKFTTLLGLGVSAAGAATGNKTLGSAGFGVAGAGYDAAVRSVLSYQRDEETSADRAALSMLRASGQSPRGMIQTFKRLAEQASIMAGRIDPYLLSHPAPTARIRNLLQDAKASPHYNKGESASLSVRHDMARAKIAAYSNGGRYAQSLLLGKKLHPAAKLYGRAITTYLYGSPKKAIPLIDQALKSNPNNAYLHEMKGEILLRSAKPVPAAVAFRNAIKLDRTKAGFLHVELGHALLETRDPKNLDEAIRQLNKGVTSDPTAVAGYQFLARAYGEKGDVGRALLASAELSMRTGKRPQARDYARRAQQSFKRGSPPWLRAEDIISAK